MYKRILIPTDGSATATAGLTEGIKLAKEQDARILIVHIVDELVAVTPGFYGSVYPLIIDQLRDAGADVLKNAQAMVAAAGLTVDTRLIEGLGGAAGEQIVRAAADWRADLIVCGTHGRRGLRRIAMGSDAEFIVRHSPVPILLIRGH